MAALTSSDFTLTNNGSTVTWTGGRLDVTRPTTSTWEVTNSGYNSGIIILQSYLSWSVSGLGSFEDIAGIKLGSSTASTGVYNDPYSAKIMSRTSAGDRYRLYGGAATFNSYDSDTTVSKSNEVKITYDTSNNNIKYWYWSGASWTQIGTTQTFDIKNSGIVYATLFYDNIQTSIGTTAWDNIYFGTYASDYSTHYPPTTSIKTALGLARASVKTWNGLAIASVKNINGLA